MGQIEPNRARAGSGNEVELHRSASGFSRRRALTLIAVTAAGGVFLPQRLFAQGTPTNLLPGADICVLVPEVTEGPYYFDPALVRNDITEGRPGAPLLVRLQVVNAACLPQANARVDIWHCDAAGLYPGYANQTGGVATLGETFLRGTLFTDANGTVEFSSIYPGWYQGRTTHIHFKVVLDERNVLNGQLFFPEDLNNAIYASHPDYARTATRGTFNANDGIAQQAGTASVAAMAQEGEIYLAQLIVGDRTNASSSEPSKYRTSICRSLRSNAAWSRCAPSITRIVGRCTRIGGNTVAAPARVLMCSGSSPPIRGEPATVSLAMGTSSTGSVWTSVIGVFPTSPITPLDKLSPNLFPQVFDITAYPLRFLSSHLQPNRTR